MSERTDNKARLKKELDSACDGADALREEAIAQTLDDFCGGNAADRAMLERVLRGLNKKESIADVVRSTFRGFWGVASLAVRPIRWLFFFPSVLRENGVKNGIDELGSVREEGQPLVLFLATWMIVGAFLFHYCDLVALVVALITNLASLSYEFGNRTKTLQLIAIRKKEIAAEA